MKELTTSPAFAITGFSMGLISLLLDLNLDGYLVAFILGFVAGVVVLLLILRRLKLPIGR